MKKLHLFVYSDKHVHIHLQDTDRFLLFVCLFVSQCVKIVACGGMGGLVKGLSGLESLS